MLSPKRIIVCHLAGQYPLGGIGWQAVHYVVGLARLGHDVYYVEDSSAAPYDPRVKSPVEDCRYSVEFLSQTMERFGLGDRWAYKDTDQQRCHGLGPERLERLYREADALINVCGASWLRAATRLSRSTFERAAHGGRRPPCGRSRPRGCG